MFGDQHAFPCQLDFHELSDRPILLERLSVRRTGFGIFVRGGTADGPTGCFKLNWVGAPFADFLESRLIPIWRGRDARDLPALVRESYRSLYKFHGPPFWSCVASLEGAVLDLLGQIAGRPVCDLLGGRVRDRVPFYLSYMSRETGPEEELATIAERARETGAQGVKFKIGGRMGRNEGPVEGRTEELISRARAALGPAITLYADANGSFPADRAIVVGRRLEEEGFALFEEPCPFEEYEETARVTAALEIPVSGGEQDCNLWQMRRMLEDDIVDVLQPDLLYVGGLLRATALARWAAACGKTIVPHSPRGDSELAAILHFCAATPNLNPLIEVPSRLAEHPWFSPAHRLFPDGTIAVPDGPGFGISYAPEVLAD